MSRWMRWWAGAFMLLSGCSLLLQPTPAGDDAGGSDDGGPGERPDASCPPPDDLLDAVNSDEHDDDDPSVSSDGLELFFNRDVAGESQLWTATRTSICDSWGAPFLASNSYAFGTPTLGSDDNTIYFTEGGNGWLIKRSQPGDSWSDRSAVEEIEDSHGHLFEARVNQQGDPVFYLHAGGSDQQEIFRAAPDNNYDLQRIIEGSLGNRARNPWVDRDESMVYFDRSAGSGENATIYRVELDQDLTPEPEQMIDLPHDHAEDPWLSSDGLLYYAARDNPLEARDLYAVEPPPTE